MSSDYQTLTAISAGVSTVYTLHLPTIMLERINAKTIDNDILISVFPNAYSNIIVTGTGVLQLSSLFLMINSYVDPLEEEAIIRLKNQYPYVFSYNDSVHKPYTATLSPSTKTTLSISPINKFVSGFFIMMRSSKSGSGLYTYAKLGGTDKDWSAFIDLRDQNGISMFGTPLRAAQLRGNKSSYWFAGNITAKLNIYPYFFTKDPTSAVIEGKNEGFLFMNQVYSLDITPGSTFTSETYNIDLYFFTHTEMIQEKGKFRLIG